MLKVVQKFIFGIKEKLREGGFGIRKYQEKIGVCHLEPIIELKTQVAGCIWIRQVRNKIKIHAQLIFTFYIGEIIDINEIFKNGIYENYLVHGKNGMEMHSTREPN